MIFIYLKKSHCIVSSQIGANMNMPIIKKQYNGYHYSTYIDLAVYMIFIYLF